MLVRRVVRPVGPCHAHPACLPRPSQLRSRAAPQLGKPAKPLHPPQLRGSAHLPDVGAVGLAVLVPVAGQLEQPGVGVVPRPAHRRNVLQRRVCRQDRAGRARRGLSARWCSTRRGNTRSGTRTAGRGMRRAVPGRCAAGRARTPPCTLARHPHPAPPVRPCCSCRSRRYTQALTRRLAGWRAVTPTAYTCRTSQRMMRRAPGGRGRGGGAGQVGGVGGALHWCAVLLRH